MSSEQTNDAYESSTSYESDHHYEVDLGPSSEKQKLMLESSANITVIGGAAGCVDAKTEFLSPEGWKPISEWQQGDKVAQYHTETGSASFVTPLEYIKKPSSGFYYINTERGLNQMLSEEHNVLYRTSKGNLAEKSAKKFVDQHNETSLGNKSKILTTYTFEGYTIPLSEQEIRLFVALKADGSIATETTDRYVVRLKKERKIKRFIWLCEEAGYNYKNYKSSEGYTVFCLYANKCSKTLREWMLCCKEQAQIIVDELKHWDSYFNPKGSRLPSFYTVNKEEADTVQYFFNICGYKASIVKDDRVGDGYKGCYTRKSVTYQVTCSNQTELNLQRKQGKKLDIPFVESEDGYKYCFTVPSGFLVLRREDCVFITGNSGKSYMMTMYPLQFIDDPNYDAIFFRRTTTQISGQGGLFDTAREMYGLLPEPLKPRIREKDYKAIFPSGATIKWSHMEHEASRFNHQGLQYSLVGFDEATHFSWNQVEYLMSRLRSSSKVDSRMVLSCNPDPDCEWLLRLIKWYLDEDGYPDPSKDGVVRWFIRRDGDFLWADTKQELLEKYGRTDAEGNLLPEDHRLQIKPLSFTFVSATIYDNPPLLEQNPEYLSWLEGLNEVDKARLLHGNWFIRPQGDNYFEREWLGKISSDDLPPRRRQVRAWDKASEEPNQVNKYPDYTASVKMSKCKQGFYYIEGASRFQRRPGDRDREILRTAHYDGDDCYIVSAVDPGSSGKFEFQEFAKFLMEEGFLLKKDPMPSNKNKLKRFEPFAISAQNGLVYIVEDSFDPEDLEQFYKELESFTGERSTSARKDDWVDSCASAFNYLTKERVLPEFTLPGAGVNDTMTSLKKDVSVGQ